MTDQTLTILHERQNTYGDFSTTAEVAQQIKHIINCNAGELTPQHQESLEMIATKMARILTGDPSYKDNWLDIAGYAHLGGELFKCANHISSDNVLPSPITSFDEIQTSAWFINTTKDHYTPSSITLTELKNAHSVSGGVYYKSKQDVVSIIEKLTGQTYQEK